jgi:hypothetical protein
MGVEAGAVKEARPDMNGKCLMSKGNSPAGGGAGRMRFSSDPASP